MLAKEPLRDLLSLIRSRYGLLFIKGKKERIHQVFAYVADQLNIPYFIWSLTQGLKNSQHPKGIYGTQELRMALEHVANSSLPGLYHFTGMTPFLREPLVLEYLKDIGDAFSQTISLLVISNGEITIPDRLRPYATSWMLPEPTEEEYATLLDSLLMSYQQRRGGEWSLEKATRKNILRQLKGLTLKEAQKILTKMIIEEDLENLHAIHQAKLHILSQDGLLEYYPEKISFAEVADLKRLKRWLTKRSIFLNHPEKAEAAGLPFPRGILLIGIPGCGKSLCAKAVASKWKLPLLKLDPSRLYSRYLGDTENNALRAMKMAEKMAPVVLWIDEIEKAFSFGGGEEDGGTAMRVLGSFLTWLQERKGDVFVVATANDIQRLPTELLRKGRFDEIFFVDLPDFTTRKEIFRIHLARHKQNPYQFSLDLLASASEGFSGAEIEQVVVSALYAALAEDQELTLQHLLDELSVMVPLSQTRMEYFRYLRDWAKERAVSAHG